MFRKVLVANRGEIAVRILRTLEEMGIPSVTVVSEADRDAPHAFAAGEVHVIGPAPAIQSYLNEDAILDVARKTGCDAVHPGYGFLSENVDFAEAASAAGLTFIGPPIEAIRLMGSKTESRRTMEAAGVPVVPGFHRKGATDEELREAARSLGVPVLVKAAAGGGGKGMRVVTDLQHLESAMSLARAEAEAAFGDGTIYIERYLDRPRHVEIQVFGDASGHIFHLGERECSVQRRHQKILEECPSPAVDARLRERMGEAAVAAARAAGYRNAGTVEFLLEADGRFHFLEMNTRLQVEHPVTEMVYGVDLVAAQILTAAGEPLTFDPADLEPRGHAIEARIYAEDPAHDFHPQTGRVLKLRHPARPGIRVDSGLSEGREIGPHYDPLLAKIIAWGDTREIATTRLRAALRDTLILGVTTNVDYLRDLLDLPAWGRGDLHTGFIPEHLPVWTEPGAPPEVLAVAATAWSDRRDSAGGSPVRPTSPWSGLGNWTPLGKS